MTMTRDQLRALYAELVDETPDLELKGKKSAYTSMNGNMFSFLGDTALAFRLGKARRREFLEQHPDSVVVSYDTVMKDYVGVPPGILEDPVALRDLWAETMANARALPPKPTTRKKKA